MASKSKKMQDAAVQLNSKETKEFLRHIIKNNQHLQENNKPVVSVEVEGESGIGKTSTMLQIANEQGLHLVKLNLAQIEELGDLVGFPVRQFEVMKDGGDTKWVDEPALESYHAQGWVTTGANRMGYCPPEWIAGKQDGGILLLDDWNRADVRFIQAVMELIDRQQYISWKLPKNWHIVLTSNPDNGEYMVQSTDKAQRTRFVSVKMKFDVECWAEWAEQNGVDSRCINFLLKHPELVKEGSNVNARSAVTFFNSISSIPVFEDQLPLIQMCGEGSVGSEFTTMFTTFIHNKLDLLMSPKDMLLGKDEAKIIDNLSNVTKAGTKEYRADIASILGTRLINYTILHAEQDAKADFAALGKRLAALINSKVFNNDLCYQIVKQIFNSNSKKWGVLTSNKDLVKYILK